MRHQLLAGTVALAMIATPALAQKKRANASAAKSDQASSIKPDQMFITDAAKGGMAEVELGKLAAQKASSPDVKQFGQRMADDHSKANDELKSLAQSKNITLPSAIDAKDKALEKRLSRLSGSAFDRAYMQAMVNDHRKDVSEFRRESQIGKDPDVKQWASKTLPTLEDHLKAALDTNKTAVGTSGTDNQTSGSKRTSTKGAGTRNPSTPKNDTSSSNSPAPNK
jgi:putative membrane protein